MIISTVNALPIKQNSSQIESLHSTLNGGEAMLSIATFLILLYHVTKMVIIIRI